MSELVPLEDGLIRITWPTDEEVEQVRRDLADLPEENRRPPFNVLLGLLKDLCDSVCEVDCRGYCVTHEVDSFRRCPHIVAREIVRFNWPRSVVVSDGE